jgi:hypothetical protein
LEASGSWWAPRSSNSVSAVQSRSQVSITLDRSSHMTPTLMSKAALLMDRLLDAQESPLHEYGEP